MPTSTCVLTAWRCCRRHFTDLSGRSSAIYRGLLLRFLEMEMDFSDEEDRDVDIESDDDDLESAKNSGGTFQTQAEKRAHHNALERKRRDHIKDSFSGLRDSVPTLQGEKAVGARLTQTSRAQILKKAADYIQHMRKRNVLNVNDIDNLRRENQILDNQIRMLEKARTVDTFGAGVLEAALIVNTKGASVSAFDGGSGTESSETESDESDSEVYPDAPKKKMRLSSPATSSSGT